ncbi:hypothetical protein [Cedratvirus kamchatka]|uniref:Uncharacterized protein n=1 Tax=Cedratvirus kamchatka TaxID=2716914 RepID=A0A6G8MYF9_9VIRU|nr:hypothetical protein [Cedratvirus kamchatka]
MRESKGNLSTLVTFGDERESKVTFCTFSTVVIFGDEREREQGNLLHLFYCGYLW